MVMKPAEYRVHCNFCKLISSTRVKVFKSMLKTLTFCAAHVSVLGAMSSFNDGTLKPSTLTALFITRVPQMNVLPL